MMYGGRRERGSPEKRAISGESGGRLDAYRQNGKKKRSAAVI